MKEAWTGEAVGRMHIAEITLDELGRELGYNKAYVSMILNGKRKPRGAQTKIKEAIDMIVARKSGQESA